MPPSSPKPYLLLAATLLAGGLAAAQSPGGHPHAPANQQNVYLALMDTMMVKMHEVTEGGSAEAYFIGQMIPHHEGAVAMADYEIEHGRASPMVQLAKSIRAEQTHELQLMRAWLKQASAGRAAGSAGFRQAMGRSMEVMMQRMPAPAVLTGTDGAFARVMIPHHQAAIDMARAVLTIGTDPTIRAFALRIISSQQVEIEQMCSFLK
ncbi:MAG: DUF305 domain-containing protein [Cytophagales bacterium]|nr:DUF305 domain-containing protein [Cytophagales bacterium]